MKTEKSYCQYEIFNKETGALEACGKKAVKIEPSTLYPNGIALCPEHLAFVQDSTEGPFTTSKKRHPADYDWLTMANRAYLSKPGKINTDYCSPTPDTIAWRPKFTWIGEKVEAVDGSPVRADYGEELLPIETPPERTKKEIHADTSTFDTPIPTSEPEPSHVIKDNRGNGTDCMPKAPE